MARFVDAQDKEFKLTEFLSYNDIILRPQYSEIESRSVPDISMDLGEFTLKCPILSAPMDCVTSANLAIALHDCGGLPVFHRFFKNWTEERDEYACFHSGDVYINRRQPLVVSVGLINGSESEYRLERLRSVEPDGYCIDIANGYNKCIINTIKVLQKTNKPIIAGSVATADGARFLCDLGIKLLRVGIGGGSACSTRIVTGMGIPNVNAILECSEVAREYNAHVIADGGIKTPGDYVKAIALGADAVMMGKVLAATTESAAKKELIQDGIYVRVGKRKIYRGQSSKEFQVDKEIYRPHISPEGESFPIDIVGSVSDVVDYFNGGLRSAMSYCGAKTIQELQDKSIFHIVSHNAYVEGTPHGKN